MYIAIGTDGVAGDEQAERGQAMALESLRSLPGFRWAMRLRDLESPSRLATASMWLSPQQADTARDQLTPAATSWRGFDVTTARGSMTPASHVAIVEWVVDATEEARFTTRWNAVFHAIEDRLGSRLLKDLDGNGRLAGLHAATAEDYLDKAALDDAIADANGLSISPLAVRRYEVIQLTEA